MNRVAKTDLVVAEMEVVSLVVIRYALSVIRGFALCIIER